MNNKPYFVYILYSKKLIFFYKGHTSNVSERLIRHNLGKSTFTKKGVPWKLIWITEKETKSLAYRLEMKLKNLSRRRTADFIQKYKEGIIDIDFLNTLKNIKITSDKH